MIVRHDKSYAMRSDALNTNFNNEFNVYIVDESTDIGAALASKIALLFPYYDFMLDGDRLIDVMDSRVKLSCQVTAAINTDVQIMATLSSGAIDSNVVFYIEDGERVNSIPERVTGGIAMATVSFASAGTYTVRAYTVHSGFAEAQVVVS